MKMYTLGNVKKLLRKKKFLQKYNLALKQKCLDNNQGVFQIEKKQGQCKYEIIKKGYKYGVFLNEPPSCLKILNFQSLPSL